MSNVCRTRDSKRPLVREGGEGDMKVPFRGVLCVGGGPGEAPDLRHCIRFYSGDICQANVIEDNETVMCGAPAVSEDAKGHTFCADHRARRQRPEGIRA